MNIQLLATCQAADVLNREYLPSLVDLRFDLTFCQGTRYMASQIKDLAKQIEIFHTNVWCRSNIILLPRRKKKNWVQGNDCLLRKQNWQAGFKLHRNPLRSRFTSVLGKWINPYILPISARSYIAVLTRISKIRWQPSHEN